MHKPEIDDLIQRVRNCPVEVQVKTVNPPWSYTWMRISVADRDLLLDIASRYRDLMA